MIRRPSPLYHLLIALLGLTLTTAVVPVSLDARQASITKQNEQKLDKATQKSDPSKPGSIEGRAQPNQTVRLRNAKTNEIVATTTADATGLYRFENLPNGNFYTTEALNADGSVATTSQMVMAMGGITATAMTAAQASAAAGTSSEGSFLSGEDGSNLGAFGSLSATPAATTASLLAAAAVGVGATAFIVSRADASPSQ